MVSVRDCWQITFVTLNGFCLLSKTPPNIWKKYFHHEFFFFNRFTQTPSPLPPPKWSKSAKRDKRFLSMLPNTQKIMSHLNLPRLVTSTSYNNILKNISNNSVDIAEQSMIKASSTLISMYTDIIMMTQTLKIVKRCRGSSTSWCNCRWDIAKTIWFQLLTGCCFYHFCWH